MDSVYHSLQPRLCPYSSQLHPQLWSPPSRPCPAPRLPSRRSSFPSLRWTSSFACKAEVSGAEEERPSQQGTPNSTTAGRREGNEGVMVGFPGQSLLHNDYWLLRHGRSIPNESGVIVADMSNGVLPKYGLAPQGYAEAKRAGELFLKDFQGSGIPAENLRIYASPFCRTKQTAEAVMEVLAEKGLHPTIKFVDDLRERYFGPALELLSDEHYKDIRKIDDKDPVAGRPEGGESVADLARRVANAMVMIDNDVQGCAVLIVSHGITIEVLQTILAHGLSIKEMDSDTLSARLHAAIDPLILKQILKFPIKTGELRHLGTWILQRSELNPGKHELEVPK